MDVIFKLVQKAVHRMRSPSKVGKEIFANCTNRVSGVVYCIHRRIGFFMIAIYSDNAEVNSEMRCPMLCLGGMDELLTLALLALSFSATVAVEAL